jgi:hypothetical protein
MLSPTVNITVKTVAATSAVSSQPGIAPPISVASPAISSEKTRG